MGAAPGADGGSPARVPPPRAPSPPPPTSGRNHWAWLKQWVRHHTSSLAATVTDFLTMVGVVELARLSPVPATTIGAAAGALLNFILGRHWTYRRGDGGVSGQAVRYLAVSIASLGLNTAGEYLLAGRLGLQYVAARVITAVVVSNAWNYPMQRFFVFGSARRSAA